MDFHDADVGFGVTNGSSAFVVRSYVAKGPEPISRAADRVGFVRLRGIALSDLRRGPTMNRLAEGTYPLVDDQTFGAGRVPSFYSVGDFVSYALRESNAVAERRKGEDTLLGPYDAVELMRRDFGPIVGGDRGFEGHIGSVLRQGPEGAQFGFCSDTVVSVRVP